MGTFITKSDSQHQEPDLVADVCTTCVQPRGHVNDANHQRIASYHETHHDTNRTGIKLRKTTTQNRQFFITIYTFEYTQF